jgi:hypothetical protein
MTKNACKVLLGKCELNRPLGILGHTWGDNTEVNHRN